VYVDGRCLTATDTVVRSPVEPASDDAALKRVACTHESKKSWRFSTRAAASFAPPTTRSVRRSARRERQLTGGQLQKCSNTSRWLNTPSTLAELANVAAFMASDEAGAMTGTVVNLSGGAIVE
jgi:enoyl-[acyl-carrier-protein] reductase (NADH)